MSIKTWQERGVKMPVVYEASAFCNDAPVCPAGKVNEAIAAMNAEITELRAALAERDAESEKLKQEHVQRLHRIEEKVDALIADRNTLQYAAQQALEAFKDLNQLEHLQDNEAHEAAITALTNALKGTE